MKGDSPLFKKEEFGEKGTVPFVQPPKLVFWETTAACNLACRHCRRLDVAQTLSREDLSTTESMRLVESLAAFPDTSLILSGGEPLMRPDIFDIARRARELSLRVALASNGTLINRALARKIRDSGIQRVAVSLDGAKAQTHDAFRKQEGSFRAAVSGLVHLDRAGLELQINTTVTQQNVGELAAVYQLAIALGARSLHFFMLVPVGCGATIGPGYQLAAETYERVLEWVYEKSLERRIHLRPICAPHYFRLLVQKRKSARPVPVRAARSGWESLSRGCLAATGIAFISHKGEVFPCGYLPLNCGSVREEPFGKIWYDSPTLNELRFPDRLGGKCGVCEYRKICGGCRARAYGETSDFLAEEPYCLYQPVTRS